MLHVSLCCEPRLNNELPWITGAERPIERLIVVVPIPIELEGVVRRQLRCRRKLHVQHQPTRAKHAVRLAKDPRKTAARQLVKEHRREHQIEAAVSVIQVLGIHLPIMDGAPLQTGPRMRVAQTRGGNVDAVHLGGWEHILPRAGVVSNRTAEVENALRPPARGAADA